jgi:hypothetical protein
MDLENAELVDMDQIDVDDQGPIRPQPERLAMDLKQQWHATIEKQVNQKLSLREEELKAQVQVCCVVRTQLRH